MTATIRRAETALTDRRDSLYARLEEGYGRIVRGIDEGADIATWENLWLALLDEYNAVCDELQVALGEPVTDPNHCEDWIANQQLHEVCDPTPRCIQCNRPVRLGELECYHCQYGALGDILMDEMLAELDAAEIDRAGCDEWLESPAARDYLPERED